MFSALHQPYSEETVKAEWQSAAADGQTVGSLPCNSVVPAPSSPLIPIPATWTQWTIRKVTLWMALEEMGPYIWHGTMRCRKPKSGATRYRQRKINKTTIEGNETGHWTISELMNSGQEWSKPLSMNHPQNKTFHAKNSWNLWLNHPESTRQEPTTDSLSLFH